MSACRQPDTSNRRVIEWAEGSGCHYRVIGAFATREEAVAEAARHAGATILFRPAPAPDPNPKDEF